MTLWRWIAPSTDQTALVRVNVVWLCALLYSVCWYAAVCREARWGADGWVSGTGWCEIAENVCRNLHLPASRFHGKSPLPNHYPNHPICFTNLIGSSKRFFNFFWFDLIASLEPTHIWQCKTRFCMNVVCGTRKLPVFRWRKSVLLFYATLCIWSNFASFDFGCYFHG